METKIYYPTSVRGKGGYEAVVNEQTVSTHFEVEAFEITDEDKPIAAGWYVTHPTGGCIGSTCGLENFDGPYESEAEAYMAAMVRVKDNGWLIPKSQADAAAEAEAAERRADLQQRQKMTPESAVVELLAAGIFQPGWQISPRVWKKPLTKIRVQKALAGDKNAAGCLRRDATKNITNGEGNSFRDIITARMTEMGINSGYALAKKLDHAITVTAIDNFLAGRSQMTAGNLELIFETLDIEIHSR